MSQPNIVLITADQFRGDCLGIAGHPDVKTPYLDTLASKGVLFSSAYSACPSCIAARASLMTGRGQASTGRVGYMDQVEWNYTDTLAETLTKAGYYTQCVGKMHVHPLRNNLGFHHVDLHDGQLSSYRKHPMPYASSQLVADDYYHWFRQQRGVDADTTNTGIDCNSWVTRPWMDDEKTHPTTWVTDRSIDFLRRRDPRKPFFLMASYVRPHPPFDAPQFYLDYYLHRSLKSPVIGDWADAERLERMGRIYDSLSGPSDPELLRLAQAGYYACITQLDHQIGRLILRLQDENVLDNTVFIFTSDHGELLGDHHCYRKALPYQGCVKVPMIISGAPLKLPTPANRVCPAVVELRDILPTCLDLAGQTPPPTVDGKSLLPLALGKAERVRDWLHGEHAYGPLSNHWIVTEKDKYAWFSQSGREQYFRLDQDPQELHDAIADSDSAPRVEALRAKLIESLTGREEGYTDGKKLIVGQKPTPVLSHAAHA